MFHIFDKLTPGKAQLRLPLGGTIQEKNKERASTSTQELAFTGTGRGTKAFSKSHLQRHNKRRSKKAPST